MAGESLNQGWRIVSRGFRGVYDRLGAVMLLSVAWFLGALGPTGFTLVVLFSAPVFGTFLVFSLTLILLFGPVSAAVYASADAALSGETSGFRDGLRDFFRFLRENYKRAAGATAAMAAILVVLIVDLYYFLFMIEAAWARYVVFFWAYFIVLWALMAQYVFPLVVKKQPRLWQTIKMCFLLAADNFVASSIVLATLVAFTAASVYLQAPVLLFVGGTLAFLHNAAFDEVMKKYGSSRRRGEDSEIKEERQDD